MTTKRYNVATAVAVAAILLAVIAAGLAITAYQSSQVPAETTFGAQGTTGFDDLDLDGNLTVAGTGSVTGAFTVTDDLVVSSGFPVFEQATTLAVTAGNPITPTSGYQPITSTAEVTASATTALPDGDKAGEVVILVNQNASDVIHVPDTANTQLSAQADLGPHDTLHLLWDGADWVEVAQTDN